MSERADAVVVGAGILGASVAHFLVERGFGDVVLVDKGAVCSGSTQYSAANVRQHYSSEVGIRLAVRAVEMFEDDVAQLGGESTDDEHVERMLEKLFRRVPGLRDRARVVEGYSGMDDITEDWYPIVGAAPELEGFYTAFGGSGHCFKLGPPIGEALADVIAGREPAIDISPLRHSRFAENDPFTSVWGPGNRA